MLPGSFSLAVVALLVQTQFQCGHKNEWPKQYAPFCNGTMQSPIDIIQANSKQMNYSTKLDLSQYRQIKISTLTLTNNGHAVQASFPEANILVKGGPANTDTYKLLQFHIHFGTNANDGSEHKIDGKQYAMEIHFVHMNIRYSNLEKALAQKDGLLVLGIIGQVNDGAPTPSPLAFVTDNLEKISTEGKETSVNGPIDLSTLIPLYDKGFYYLTYPGSLTTPKCDEAVIWVVNNAGFNITNADLDKFRTLQGSDNKPMAGNVRPIQLLNDRTVLFDLSAQA